MIFVSIASYRDPELTKTISSLMKNADNPEEIILGIVSQDLSNKHPKLNMHNVRQINIAAKDAKGAGYARKLAMELYENEEYFMQIDSHMRFAKSWDTKLKSMLAEAQKITGKEKVILSQFPAPYFVGSDGKDYFIENDEVYWDRPSWSGVRNNVDGSWGAYRIEMEDKSKPHPTHTILAGFVFTIGKIVEEIPYDERIPFMGEELCFAIRAYTRGWELYAPNEMVIWHFYTRKEMPKVWSEGVRETTWIELESESHAVQRAVLLAEERGTYGIEDYDRYFDYQDMIGINFHDFYVSGVLNFKANMSILVEELDFSGFGIHSGYCLNDLHDQCKQEVCECQCHKEK
jgi:hypothetical protein